LVLGCAVDASLPAQHPEAPAVVRFAVLDDNGTGQKPQYDIGAQMHEARATFPFSFVMTIPRNAAWSRGFQPSPAPSIARRSESTSGAVSFARHLATCESRHQLDLAVLLPKLDSRSPDQLTFGPQPVVERSREQALMVEEKVVGAPTDGLVQAFQLVEYRLRRPPASVSRPSARALWHDDPAARSRSRE
jgi:hypothetical protein